MAAYGLILPKAILEAFPKGCVNIHASLLPFFKGAAPINWAIKYGMKNTGLTSFVMDDKIDSGEIINNVKIPIEDSDDFGTIYNRLSVLSVGFTIDTIQRITGYLVGTTSRWNKGKLAELHDRVTHN